MIGYAFLTFFVIVGLVLGLLLSYAAMQILLSAIYRSALTGKQES
jgi:hypothetical protein